MKTKHTPGPWTHHSESIDSNFEHWEIITDKSGNIIANVNAEMGPDIAPLVSIKMPKSANAALIAASPELLEALKRATGYMTDIAKSAKLRGENLETWARTASVLLDAEVDKARAAIQKATGEA